MEPRRVVVTGMGALTAVGNTLQDYWSGLMTGRSGSAPITRFNAERFKTRFACEIKGFDGAEHFGPKDARKMDAYTQYALVVADEAIKDAGIELDRMRWQNMPRVTGARALARFLSQK